MKEQNKMNIYHSAQDAPDVLPPNSIVNDCFINALKKIADKSVDLVCIDPPYLSTDLDFDKAGFDLPTLKTELARIIKPSGYIACFGTIELLAAFINPFSIRYSGVWLKPRGTMRTATAKKPMSKCEPYAVFCLKGAKISDMTFNRLKIEGGKPYAKKQNNTGYERDGKDSLSRSDNSGWTKDGYVSENDGFRWQTDVIEAPHKGCMKHSERTDHPTQKPIAALSVLIKMLSNEGNLVVDCFGGSGSTGETCIQLKRDFIIIEKDKTYFNDIIAPRLTNAIENKNAQLFNE
jgi:DNA modification methylase